MQRRGGGRAARVRAHQVDRARARCSSSRRASPSGSAKSSGWRATPASSPCAGPSCRSTPSRAPTSSCSTRIGELAQLYQLATAVFVGGSLVDHGGHNILEPAVFGKPIVFGPHMQNFKEIADAFLANGAAVQVQSERELEEALLALVTDPVRRARLGAAARALVEANRGAKDKTLRRHRRAAAAAGDRRRRPALPPGALSAVSSALDLHGAGDPHAASSLYGAVAGWRRRWYTRDPRAQRRLAPSGHQRRQPARRRQRQDAGRRAHRAPALDGGERPAILTRGYGAARRRSTASRSCPTATRVLRRSRPRRRRAADARARAAGRAGARRRRPLPRRAASPKREFGATVHVLDDGFQHLKLARDVDLLLVDEDDLTDRVLPAGRLREPLAARRAADAAARDRRLTTRRPSASAGALGVPTRLPRHAARSARRRMDRRPASRSSSPTGARACSPSPASRGPSASSPI